MEKASVRAFSTFNQKIAALFVGLMFLFTLIIPAVTIGEAHHAELNQPQDSVVLHSLRAVSQTNASIPKTTLSTVIFDGNITAGEYSGSYDDSITGIDAYWEHDGENLTIGLVSQGTGWVALGFGQVMNGSNMIMGGDDDGTPYCYDLVGEDWSHVDDTTRGGTFDVLEWDASDDGVNTVFEFRIPLTTTDTLDPDMQENGTYPVFFAFHIDIDGYTRHTLYSFLQVTLQPLAVYLSTAITLSVPTPPLEPGDEIELSATLTNQSLDPLVDLPVDFFRRTQFGDISIGNDTTDANGQANLAYRNSELKGTHTFGVKFVERVVTGTGQPVIFRASEATFDIDFGEEESEEHLERDLFFIAVQVVIWV
ncbi:MAG: DOMON domain-containing protein, partial [Candidatus Hodarchaeales archaeon]